MDRSYAVLLLRSDKVRDFGEFWREKRTRATWTGSFRPSRQDKLKATQVAEAEWFCFQVEKLREEITNVRETLAKKDELSPDAIRQSYADLQQKSLKLFEMAYKKVSRRCAIRLVMVGGTVYADRYNAVMVIILTLF